MTTTASASIPQVTIPDNRNGGICSRCTMVCCVSMPGIVWPMDLAGDASNLTAAIVEKLRTGSYSIDWWEGDVKPRGRLSRVMYLRPATVGKEWRIEDPSWGGQCTFLGPDGCGLAWDERPTGCKALVPVDPSGLNCGDTTIDGINYTAKDAAVLAWRPYQSQIHAAIREVQP